MKGKEQSSKPEPGSSPVPSSPKLTLTTEMRQKVSRSSFRDALSALAFGPSSKEKAWAMLTWGEEDYGGIRDVTGLVSLLTKPKEMVKMSISADGVAIILLLRPPTPNILKNCYISRDSVLTKLLPATHLKVRLFITKPTIYGEKTYFYEKEIWRLELKDMMLVLHDPEDPPYSFSFMGLGEDELYFGDLGLGLNLKI